MAEPRWGLVVQQAGEIDYATMQGSGVEWIRGGVPWCGIEPEAEGRASWGKADDQVRLAKARGIRIMWNLDGTPAWASTLGRTFDPRSPCRWKGDPPRVDAWQRFVERIVTRYAPHGVRDYTIWNEPNGPDPNDGDRPFFNGTRDQFLTGVLRPAAEVIRGLRGRFPDLRVCAAEITLDARHDPRAWLHEMLEQAGDVIDVVTVHAYDQTTSSASGIFRALGPGNALRRGAYDVVVDAHRRYHPGLPLWPIWLTETAWWRPDGSGLAKRTREVRDGVRERQAWLHRIAPYVWIHDGHGDAIRNGRLPPWFVTYREICMGVTTPRPVPRLARDAEWVRDDLPERLEPGEQRRATLTLRNSGTVDWVGPGDVTDIGPPFEPQAFALASFGEPQLGVNVLNNLTFGQKVAAGHSYEFALELTAPRLRREIELALQMIVHGAGSWFGAPVRRLVQIGEPRPDPRPDPRPRPGEES